MGWAVDYLKEISEANLLNAHKSIKKEREVLGLLEGAGAKYNEKLKKVE